MAMNSKTPLFFPPLFSTIYGVFLLLSIASVLVYDKLIIHTTLNAYHTPFFDTLFTYLTYLGDGAFVAVAAVLTLLFSIRKGLFIGLVAIVTGLLAQFFKRIVFADHLRPVNFLSEMPEVATVSDVVLRHHFSFPSGHTTSAFAFFILVALLWQKRWLGLGAILMALLAGYSRIYLSQHFLEDVIAGSLLGSVTAWLLFTYLYPRFIPKLEKPLFYAKS